MALTEAFAGHGGAPADPVILSGGLGPTCDDSTCRTVAAFFGLPLELHEPSLRRIEAYFAARGKSMTANNRKQALLPRGATVFPNDWGTAPGMAFGDANRTVILLPGPPCELEPMFDACAAPFLAARAEGILVSRNLHIMGMGEAEVEQVLRPLMESSVNPTLAPYCRRVRCACASRRVPPTGRKPLLCATVRRRRSGAHLSAPAFTAPTYRTWKPDLSVSCGARLDCFLRGILHGRHDRGAHHSCPRRIRRVRRRVYHLHQSGQAEPSWR